MKQNDLGYAHDIIYKLNDLKNPEDIKIRDTVTPDFTAQNCLSGAVKVTKDTNTSQYKYTCYGIVYDFAVDYVPIRGVKSIYDIHRYLMTKHNKENV